MSQKGQTGAQACLVLFTVCKWIRMRVFVLEYWPYFAKFKKANSDNTLSLSLPSADNLTLLHKNCVATLSDFLNKDTVNSDLTAEASAWLISKSMLQIQQTYQPQFKALQSAVANPKLAITNPPVIVFDTEFGAVLNLCKQATN